MDKREQLLGQAPINKALISMSVPAIIGMLVNAIYNAVDTMFVGRLGTEQLGAATIVFPLFTLIGAIGITFGIGAASYISRLLGERNKEKANVVAIDALLASFVCGIIYTVIGNVFLEEILTLFGATDTMMPYAISYARYLTLGAIFTMINMTMNNILRAEGSTNMAMISMSTGAILNILFDYILIVVFDFGIAGASIATVFAQMVSTTLLLRYFILEKSVLRLKLRFIHISTEIYGEIVKIGGATFFRQVFASVGLALINNAAKPYGDTSIAAIGVVNRAVMVASFVVFGFSQGFLPVAGYNFGAKKYDRLNETIKKSVLWSSVYSIIVTLLFWIFAAETIAIFTNETEVIELGTRIIRAYTIFFPLMGFLVIITSLFQALGHAKEGAILSLARQGFFLIPTIIILPNIFDFTGVIYAQPAADFLTVILTAIFSIRIIRELQKRELEYRVLE